MYVRSWNVFKKLMAEDMVKDSGRYQLYDFISRLLLFYGVATNVF